MSLAKIQIPQIAEEEMTPIISQLIEIIEQLSANNKQQAELIQQLKDEIARLKGHSARPKIKPSSLENKDAGKKKVKVKSGLDLKKEKKQPNCKFTKLSSCLWKIFHQEPSLKDIILLLFRGSI